MKSAQDWLAAQVAGRPDDFAPEEMAAPLAWIASIQADALEAAAEQCEARLPVGDGRVAEIERGANDLCAIAIRALKP